MSAAETGEALAGRLRAEHRKLDALFGGFLAAAAQGDAEAAEAAIAAFDDMLRRHTALEEERLFPPAAGKLVARPDEDAVAALARALRLEHVQIRELSGMMRRLLGESKDLEGVRRLAGSLARRWDAHTAREETELLGSAAQ